MKKVLVVDDSETIRLEVKRALSGAGFSVIEAGDGAAGLALAIRHPDLSLVILDVNMPVMSGLDMLDRLSEQPATAKLPVMLLTTEAQESLIDRAKKAGAKGWMIKPIRPDLLLLAANKLAR
jgi:two-component system chemotaxis response regulator CheY